LELAILSVSERAITEAVPAAPAAKIHVDVDGRGVQELPKANNGAIWKLPDIEVGACSLLLDDIDEIRAH